MHSRWGKEVTKVERGEGRDPSLCRSGTYTGENYGVQREKTRTNGEEGTVFLTAGLARTGRRQFGSTPGAHTGRDDSLVRGPSTPSVRDSGGVYRPVVIPNPWESPCRPALWGLPVRVYRRLRQQKDRSTRKSTKSRDDDASSYDVAESIQGRGRGRWRPSSASSEAPGIGKTFASPTSVGPSSISPWHDPSHGSRRINKSRGDPITTITGIVAAAGDEVATAHGVASPRASRVPTWPPPKKRTTPTILPCQAFVSSSAAEDIVESHVVAMMGWGPNAADKTLDATGLWHSPSRVGRWMEKEAQENKDVWLWDMSFSGPICRAVLDAGNG
ncbi:hypothetical protein QBC39DRAFT_437607 [Podospora conica]|nr:hypothetical protein QBC39DRAFT_437607 [Schizothecium conicum]